MRNGMNSVWAGYFGAFIFTACVAGLLSPPAVRAETVHEVAVDTASVPTHTDMDDVGVSDDETPFQLTPLPADLFDDILHFVQDTAPAPVGPQLFETDPTDPLAARARSENLFGGGIGTSESLLSANRRAAAARPATSVVLGAEAKVLVTTDAGSLLRKSTAGLGVAAQQRSPIVTDPRVRGSSLGQLLASGSYWFPARPDLDTLVSKIDSRLIQDVIVIKGPYAARYGPGFNFIDFELLPTPRYYDGPERHSSTSLDYKTNGDQWYGRALAWGGSDNYGYRVGYGHGVGIDYRTGSGARIPSSYNSRNYDAAIGFDIDEDRSVEFAYLRQEQTGVELANNVFDLRFLETDAFEVKYRDEYGSFYDLFTLEGWYNQTRFDGNNFGSGKRAFMPILDTIGWRGTVDAENMSTGFTAATTWGELGYCSLTLGADLRYLKQNIDEIDVTTVGPPFAFGLGVPENFPVPDARTENPGLFMEFERPLNCRWMVRGGGRVDWVHTNAASTAPLALLSDPSNTYEEFFFVDSMSQNFRLASFYLTSEYQIDDCHTAILSGGYAERAPTMFQLYAGAPLANIMSQFATSIVFGHPHLATEKRWQVDAGLTANYTNLRAGVNGYFAWVEDYITLDFLLANPVAGFPLYGFVNTDLAILTGFEAYGEYDVSCSTTLFATASYTAGRDTTLNQTSYFQQFFGFTFTGSRDTLPEQPLPMIPPLEARLGIRWQEPCCQRYGAELSARVVDNQDRIASLLLERATPGFTTFDARGFWRPTDNLTMIAGVENIGDRNYQEHLDPRNFAMVFQPGVNFYTGVEFVR